MSSQWSPAQRFVEALKAAYGVEGAAAKVVEFCDAQDTTALAGLMLDWRGWWARPKQLPPEGRWRSWGFLGGRGMGKTRSCVEFINHEVDAGRATRIALAAQKLDRTIGMQVQALIDTAPPWNRPEWIDSKLRLVWPNGAYALALTPEVPGEIRGDNYDLSWVCELQSWPTATMEEAFDNFQLSTRVGLARIVWDCTPKRRHPILLGLLDAAKENPEIHHVVRGTIYENAANLAPGVIADLERKMKDTQRGKEELLGEMLSEEEGATCEQEWIDQARRPRPDVLLRKVISIDPAATDRAGSDESGVCVAGLGHDGQAYVLADLSGKHAPHILASMVLDTYVAEGCDLVLIETNKIGLYATQNLRAVAQTKGLGVVVVDKNWIPQRVPRTVFVREIFSRGDKAERAQPLSTAYQRGRVSHVIGADLRQLEEVLTTWVPQPGRKVRSPDRLDACVGAVVELLSLATIEQAADPRVAFKGLREANQALATPGQSARRANLAALLRPAGSGMPGRI